MATASEIAEIVRAYGVRGTVATTTQGSNIDIVFDAVNNAKRWLQKKTNWYLLRKQQQVVCPVAGLDITLEANGGFKTLSAIYSVDNEGNFGEKVNFITQIDAQSEKEETYGSFDNLTVYQQGKSIYVNNAIEDTDLWLLGYEQLPDYVAGSLEEDIFTEYAEDFLRLFALKKLTSFIKDDDRVSISQRDIDEEYRALLQWNSSLERANETWEG